MTPAQWRRVNDLYHAALETPAERRRAFVAQQTDDDTVRRELERLLEVDPDRTAAVDRGMVPEGDFTRLFAPAVSPGDYIAGRYRILKEVGSGGMGQVYEALDEELHTRIALKIIRPELAGDPRVLARFKQEVQLARQVTHPSVCRTYDLVRATHRDRDLLFLCMEFVEGETLSARLRSDGAFALSEAEPIIEQISAGLAAAHVAGVVHRDLKSGNIFLSKNRDGALRVVIADFGLAGNVAHEAGATRQTSSGWGVGTPAYMAPEQVEGGKIGPPADIYAFGIVMYEMATGQLPYDGLTPLQVAVRRLKEKPRAPRELNAKVDARWEAVILRCLETDPADRFAEASEIPRAIETGRRMGPVRLKKMRRPLAALAVGVGLLAVGWAVKSRLDRPTLPPEAARLYSESIQAIRNGSWLRAHNALQLTLQKVPSYAPARARYADALMELDYFDRATQEILRATDLPKARSEETLVAAIRALLTRDYDKACPLFDLDAADSNASDRALALLYAGRCYERKLDRKTALERYAEALKLDPSLPAALLEQAAIRNRNGENAESLKSLDTAEAVFQRIGNAEGFAEVAYQRAKFTERAGQLPAAIEQARLAQRRAEEAQSDFLRLRALSLESILAARSGDFARARQIGEEASALAIRTGQDAARATALLDLSNAFITHKNYEEAMTYAEQGYRVAEASGARLQLGRALTLQARILSLQQRIAEGLGLLERAQHLYRTAGLAPELLRSKISYAAALMGYPPRHQEAKAVWEAALPLAEKLGERQYVPYIHLNIGREALDRSDFPAAQRSYEAALKAAEISEDKPYARTAHVRLAQIAMNLGQYAQARRSLADARALHLPGEAGELELRLREAIIEIDTLNFSAAETILNEIERTALANRQKNMLTDIAIHRCVLWGESGKTVEARRICKSVEPELQRIEARGSLASLRLGLAAGELASGNFQFAARTALEGAQMFAAAADVDNEFYGLLLAARAYQAAGEREKFLRTRESVRQKLDGLRRAWGNGAVEGYLSRPILRGRWRAINE